MDWTEQVFRYCERGLDPAFWAEPLNALTNLCFWLAAFAAWRLSRQTESDMSRTNKALIGLVAVIALGSFLFHTTAARWASIADLAPISLFMLAYFAYAFRHLLQAGWPLTLLGLAAFVAALYFAAQVTCAPGFMPVSNVRGLPCLNGTAGYAPAVIAMTVIGAALLLRRHAAWPHLLSAALVFTVSMAFRAFDFEFCDQTLAFGHNTGTHFIWHTLNAVVLYLLLRAAILYGRPAASFHATPRQAART